MKMDYINDKKLINIDMNLIINVNIILFITNKVDID